MVQSTFGKPPHRRPPYTGVATESLYVPMSDGARIAVDVLRPRNAPADLKLPAILVIARYWRSFALRGFAPPGRAPIGPRQALPDFLVPLPWGSWFDGCTADGVLRRFVGYRKPLRAVIGAWRHGYLNHGSPYGPPAGKLRPELKALWWECWSTSTPT